MWKSIAFCSFSSTSDPLPPQDRLAVAVEFVADDQIELQGDLLAGLERDLLGIDIALDGILEDAVDVIVDIARGIAKDLAAGAGHAERIGPLGIAVGHGGDENPGRIEELAAQLRQQAAAVFLMKLPADQFQRAVVAVELQSGLFRGNILPPVDLELAGLLASFLASSLRFLGRLACAGFFSGFKRCHCERM